MESHNGFVNDLRRNVLLRRIKIAAVVAVLVIVGAAAGIGAAFYFNQPTDTFAAATSKVGYKVYVPGTMPAGMRLNNDAAVREGAVIFSVSSADGTIVFTEQPIPKGIKMEDFYSLRIKGVKDIEGLPFPTVMGTSPAGDATVASLLTDSTWVLVTGPTGLAEQDVRAIIQNLQAR